MIGKTYILYSKWGGTAVNHAGMAYLVERTKKAYPDKTKLIKIPSAIAKWPYLLQRLHFHSVVLYLSWVLKEADRVLFVEYMGVASGNQAGIALKLRRRNIRSRFFGMVHLSGAHLRELYESDGQIRDAAKNVDKIIVLGGALAAFFAELGFGEKVIQTFHYVDNDYYQPAATPVADFKVVHMGCHKRDFNLLQNIVEANPDIQFHICQGYLDLKAQFSRYSNAQVHGYMTEPELLQLMQSCQVSLSAMLDAVGSNVISCSMACGLVNVVSDVGSIRDYCNENNSILCKTAADFTAALKTLKENKSLLSELSKNSLAYSSGLSISSSIDFFYREVISS